jgi:hypothetical protein
MSDETSPGYQLNACAYVSKNDLTIKKSVL